MTRSTIATDAAMQDGDVFVLAGDAQRFVVVIPRWRRLLDWVEGWAYRAELALPWRQRGSFVTFRSEGDS